MLYDPLLHNLSLGELQRGLSVEAVYVKFFIRKNVSLAIIIDSDSWKVVELPNKSEIEWMYKELVHDLKNPYSDFIPNASRFSRVLQVKKLISSEKTLLICNLDGPIDSLPIETLNISSITNVYKPLGERVNVVNIYSIFEYLQDKQRSQNNIKFTPKITVLADPTFQSRRTPTTVHSSGRRNWERNLARLPWTAKEANQIEEQFPNLPVVVYTGSKATNDALLSEQSRASNILHIASHGYFSEKNPNIVGIATANEVDKTNRNSGFVTLTNLLSHRFWSRLVVISGCETALGEHVRGEGLNSLSRGMLIQGAGSVVATYWSIPDRPTSVFMAEFYRQLKISANSLKALSDTKRFFISSERYRHPFFWAAFSLTASNAQSLDAVLRD